MLHEMKIGGHVVHIHLEGTVSQIFYLVMIVNQKSWFKKIKVKKQFLIHILFNSNSFLFCFLPNDREKYHLSFIIYHAKNPLTSGRDISVLLKWSQNTVV